jgi:CTP synthase
VTDDGAETDLDLERFLNVPTSQANNATGRFIFRLLKREKRRVFGKPFKWYPHITNEIKDRMQLLGNSGDYDIVITEIGEQ